MRWTILIAVRHRSNSSSCFALKSSSGPVGLRIKVDGMNRHWRFLLNMCLFTHPRNPRSDPFVPAENKIHSDLSSLHPKSPLSDSIGRSRNEVLRQCHLDE